MKSASAPFGVRENRRGFAVLAVLVLSGALFVSLTVVTRFCFLWRGMEREFAARNRETAARIMIYRDSADNRDGEEYH